MDPDRRRELAAELGNAAIPWKAVSGTVEGSVIRWTPIALFETARLDLGISSNGWWVRATEQTAREFPAGQDCVFLLPILEVAPIEVHQRLLDGLRARGLSEEFVELFPFEDVVVTGLESQSEHWASLALRWAKTIGRSSRVERALAALADSGPTQKLRHAGRRLLKSKTTGGIP
jgi:hypothetical protein